MKTYVISYKYTTEERLFDYRATAIIHNEEELRTLMSIYSSMIIENIWELNF